MIYRFGDFEFSPDTYQLRRAGAPVHLEPRVFEVLGYLLANGDRVVAKKELLGRLWPGRAVSDSALSRTVRDARRALGDTGAKERWIQTVHGRGFRFAGEACEVTPPAGMSPASETDLHAYQLYLQGRYTLSRYTAEGIEKAIGYLEQAVAADPSFALGYVGLARVYRESAAVGVVGLPPLGAYERAKEAVARALTIDPNLGEAHGLAGLLKYSCDFDWHGAEVEFQRALELSPRSADIYDHYGWMCESLERFDDAIRLLKRALELDPLSHPSDLANTMLRAGRNAEALEMAAKVIAFDPELARGHSVLGWALLKTSRPAEGLAAIARAVQLTPGGTLFVGQLGEAYALAGKIDEAREILRTLHEIAGQRYVSPIHFAYVHTGLGEADTAIDYLERACDQRAPNIAGVKGSYLFTSLRSHPRFTALLRRMNLA